MRLLPALLLAALAAAAFQAAGDRQSRSVAMIADDGGDARPGIGTDLIYARIGAAD